MKAAPPQIVSKPFGFHRHSWPCNQEGQLCHLINSPSTLIACNTHLTVTTGESRLCRYKRPDILKGQRKREISYVSKREALLYPIALLESKMKLCEIVVFTHSPAQRTKQPTIFTIQLFMSNDLRIHENMAFILNFCVFEI